MAKELGVNIVFGKPYLSLAYQDWESTILEFSRKERARLETEKRFISIKKKPNQNNSIVNKKIAKLVLSN